MARQIEVEQVSRSCLLVRGRNARELLKEVTRTAPVWATRDRAWVTQPHRLADLCALAESRHIEVIISICSPEQMELSCPEQMEMTPARSGEGADPGQGLW